MWAKQLDDTGFLQTTLLCYSGVQVMMKFKRTLQMWLGQ